MKSILWIVLSLFFQLGFGKAPIYFRTPELVGKHKIGALKSSDNSNFIVVLKTDNKSPDKIKGKTRIDQEKTNRSNYINKHMAWVDDLLLKNKKSITRSLNETKENGITVKPTKEKVYSSVEIGKKFAGYVGAFQNETLNKIAENDDVLYIEEELTLSLNDQYNIQNYGLAKISSPDGSIDSNTYYFTEPNGKNVSIYIIDSGVSSIKEFGNRLRKGYNGWPEEENTDNYYHGTHVAGIAAGKMYGVAKEAEIVSVKIFDKNGKPSPGGLITCLGWVVEDHKNSKAQGLSKAAVVNLSLGSMGESRAYNDALAEMYNQGIHVVVSSGNGADDACKYTPASNKNVITVGAIDKNDAIASWTNYGKCVDIFAPGDEIVSAKFDDEDGNLVLSGSSMSAPHVTGIKHTKNYPDEAPNYSIETDTDIDTNLTQDEIEEMNTKMEEIIQDNMGMAMIFSMASSLKESLDELLIKKLEEAETVEKERIDKEIELEQKKFVGTKVTRQVFMEWKKRFELEQATENKLSELDIKKLESKKQRLTGNNNIS
ncbi:hypothetical protein BB559_005288 [Furculomyces boomerangus]|uniref:RWD domain-containing protein n=1 Tax=Furculomyces boomerangus TaxID=61424 RepID=A0A2T9Y9C5_9FUNG|nr:hypothetical protein BB559_005288 [Furculomyces boomerangus]